MSGPADRCSTHDTHCVTCADEGVPMTVERVAADGLARCVDEEDRGRDVQVDLIGPVEPGDLLLVHAGVALVRLGGRTA